MPASSRPVSRQKTGAQHRVAARQNSTTSETAHAMQSRPRPRVLERQTRRTKPGSKAVGRNEKTPTAFKNIRVSVAVVPWNSAEASRRRGCQRRTGIIALTGLSTKRRRTKEPRRHRSFSRGLPCLHAKRNRRREPLPPESWVRGHGLGLMDGTASHRNHPVAGIHQRI